jgi:hypothetical protein
MMRGEPSAAPIVFGHPADQLAPVTTIGSSPVFQAFMKVAIETRSFTIAVRAAVAVRELPMVLIGQ